MDYGPRGDSSSDTPVPKKRAKAASAAAPSERDMADRSSKPPEAARYTGGLNLLALTAPPQVVDDSQKFAVAARSLRDALGVTDVIGEPAIAPDDAAVEAWCAWCAGKTSLVALDSVIKTAGIVNRFEAKKVKVARLIKWAVE